MEGVVRDRRQRKDEREREGRWRERRMERVVEVAGGREGGRKKG